MLDACYRLLLRACPPDAAVAPEEMAAVARACVEREAARRGRVGRLWGIGRALTDLVIFIVTARRDARARSARGRDAGSMTETPRPRRTLVRARDIRSAFRLMAQQRVLSAAVIVMLALGIGSTTAIFSVIRGVLLRPLALDDPDRIVEIYAAMPRRSIDNMVLAEGNAWDVRDLNTAFSAVGIAHGAAYSIAGHGEPDRVGGQLVSAAFFQAMGLRPILGRTFEDGDDAIGAVAERVVISEALWASRYGRSTSIVGDSISLDGKRYEVLGVVPVEPVTLRGDDVFVPLLRSATPDRGSWEYQVIGRLRPGATMDDGRADLTRIAAAIGHHKDNTGLELHLRSSSEWTASPELRRTLWVMLAAVGLLLAIASVNVANLLFVRAAGRTRERAVRTALGAARADLVRESLTESLVFSVIGALAGAALSAGMLRAFKALDPGAIPRLAEVSMDPAVWLFTLAVTLVVGLTTGLLPALRAPFASLVAALRQGQRGAIGDRRQDRTRAAFVVVEVALSVLMLVGAGLLVRSLSNVLSADRGFATDHRLTAEVTMPGVYPSMQRAEIAGRILERVAALPDVVAVGAVSGRMLVGGGTGMNFSGADSTLDSADVPWATWRNVTKDFFPAIGLTLKAGRAFTEQDLIAEPWRVVISERLASRIWPGQSAVGRTAILWKGQSEFRADVIGVVSDMREHRLDEAPTMTVYLPAYGGPLGSTTLRLVMHTRGEPALLGPTLRKVVGEIDATLPLTRIRSLEEMVSRSVATRRFAMVLLLVFALLALILALAGVGGVLLYTMTRRTGEMGLRLALGARPGALVGRALRQGLVPVVAGLVIGTGVALWLSGLMASLLYGVTPADPATYAAVGLGLLATAAIACYLPARRVLRIDPAIALRSQDL